MRFGGQKLCDSPAKLMRQAGQKSCAYAVCSSPILAFPVRYPKLYEEAKEHWVKQLDLDCKNLQLLKNAAAFFSFHELNIAEQLILNAIKLDPNNIYWAERLNEIKSLTDG
jgi:hypothetical protein